MKTTFKATSPQLESVDDENVPKNARVARNVFSIRGENGVYFDVNEEAWPNADLTIPALKPNDLNKTLKHIMGYSDADWAGDPVTRKSTSCTLCDADQFLLTSERRGQGTVALSSGETEVYALGALSAELIFAQAILKEFGLSVLIHARADSSTARPVATKQGASRKMKHIHTRFLFIQDLVFRKLLTMSSVKTDVNPSDIGTKALGRERFHRLRSSLAWVLS